MSALTLSGTPATGRVGFPRSTLAKSALFVAVVLGGAAGCSSAAPPSQAVPPSAAASDGAASPRPFEALQEIAEDNKKALHDAEERSVALCMKALGFQYTPRDFEAARQDGREGPRRGDVAAARTQGYGIADNRRRGEEAVAENDPEKARDLARLSPEGRQAFTNALLGAPPTAAGPNDATRATVVVPGGAQLSVDTSSCASKARTAVYGDDSQWQQLVVTVDQLQGEVYQNVAADPAYRSAVRPWQSCMRDRGFDYQEPGVAADVLSRQVDSGELDLDRLRPLELRVATADAECFRAAGLVELSTSLIAKHEKQVAAANEGVIVKFKELQQRSIDRAKSVLRSGSG